MRESRVARDGVAVAAKAEGLREGTGWGKGGVTLLSEQMKWLEK